jgi:hypothetical protein
MPQHFPIPEDTSATYEFIKDIVKQSWIVHCTTERVLMSSGCSSSGKHKGYRTEI